MMTAAVQIRPVGACPRVVAKEIKGKNIFERGCQGKIKKIRQLIGCGR